MAEMLPKKQAIEIENCEIKPSRRGEKLEILLKADSRISESPKKIEVADIDFEDETPEEIELDALEGKFEYAKVTVGVKIHRVSEPDIVRTGKKKQEVLVADKKSTAKVTLWEDQVGSLTEGVSYCLQSFVVKEFGGEKYLSMGVESKIIPIADMEVLKISSTEKTLKDVTIVSVPQNDCYRACLRCNARVEAADEGNGRCSRPDCRMLQKLEFCSQHVNAQLMVLAENRFETLTVYGKVLYDLLEITPGTEVTENMFLRLPKLQQVTYNEKNIIINFRKVLQGKVVVQVKVTGKETAC